MRIGFDFHLAYIAFYRMHEEFIEVSIYATKSMGPILGVFTRIGKIRKNYTTFVWGNNMRKKIINELSATKVIYRINDAIFLWEGSRKKLTYYQSERSRHRPVISYSFKEGRYVSTKYNFKEVRRCQLNGLT